MTQENKKRKLKENLRQFVIEIEQLSGNLEGASRTILSVHRWLLSIASLTIFWSWAHGVLIFCRALHISVKNRRLWTRWIGWRLRIGQWMRLRRTGFGWRYEISSEGGLARFYYNGYWCQRRASTSHSVKVTLLYSSHSRFIAIRSFYDHVGFAYPKRIPTQLVATGCSKEFACVTYPRCQVRMDAHSKVAYRIGWRIWNHDVVLQVESQERHGIPPRHRYRDLLLDR